MKHQSSHAIFALLMIIGVIAVLMKNSEPVPEKQPSADKPVKRMTSIDETRRDEPEVTVAATPDVAPTPISGKNSLRSFNASDVNPRLVLRAAPLPAGPMRAAVIVYDTLAPE